MRHGKKKKFFNFFFTAHSNLLILFLKKYILPSFSKNVDIFNLFNTFFFYNKCRNIFYFYNTFFKKNTFIYFFKNKKTSKLIYFLKPARRKFVFFNFLFFLIKKIKKRSTVERIVSFFIYMSLREKNNLIYTYKKKIVRLILKNIFILKQKSKKKPFKKICY